jgi:transmembrane sensor
VKEWVNKPTSEISEHLTSQWEEDFEQFKGDVSLKHIYDKIHYNILLEEKDKAKKMKLWAYYQQVAAILLIPVLAFSLWYFLSEKTIGDNVLPQQSAQSWIEINAPDGARVEFLLPDSSSGWLNSGSKLKYPAVFNEDRKVELSGEAWFNVKHHDESVFLVSVPDMDINVLGTQFNVSAYPEEDFTDVSLEEGKIEVRGRSGVFSQTLIPNEKILFNQKTRTLSLTEVDATRFSAWKEGYLIIDNEPLRQVIGRLERRYNVYITIQDNSLKEHRFKATFKDEPLEEVLRLIAKTTPINYTIEDRTTDTFGVTKQKKVTINLKI